MQRDKEPNMPKSRIRL